MYVSKNEYVIRLNRTPKNPITLTDPRMLTNEELIDLINQVYYKETLVDVTGNESMRYYNKAIEEAREILKDGKDDRRRYGGYIRGTY